MLRITAIGSNQGRLRTHPKHANVRLESCFKIRRGVWTVIYLSGGSRGCCLLDCRLWSMSRGLRGGALVAPRPVAVVACLVSDASKATQQRGWRKAQMHLEWMVEQGESTAPVAAVRTRKSSLQGYPRSPISRCGRLSVEKFASSLRRLMTPRVSRTAPSVGRNCFE